MISGLKTDRGAGSKNKGNEDNVITLELQIDKGPDRGKYKLLALADGMGGLKKGEIASALTIKGIAKSLINRLVSEESFFSQNDKPLDPELLLKESIEITNLLVYNVSKREGNTSMGSTIVAGLIKNGKLFIGHVGDSRAYLVRRDKIEKLTKDHSLIQVLYESNLINTAEIKEYPQKNVITRAIGFAPRVEVEINEKRNGKPVTLQSNDIIILCSDGITNVLNESEMLKVTADKPHNPQLIANELVNKANFKGTDDNATALCAIVEKEDLLPAENIKIKMKVDKKQTPIPTVILPPPVILCPYCGHKNFLGDIYCNLCRKNQIFIHTNPMIVIIDGPEKGKNIEINKDEIYIGRDEEGNDMHIKEPQGREFISKKHIKITKKGDDYWIEDLNSKNGTKVRGLQIHGKELRLQKGDFIIIGMNTLEFR